MIVALARKLLIALWRMVTTGVVPVGVELGSGTVKLPNDGHQATAPSSARSNGGGYSDDLAPGAESPAASSTIFGGGTEMTTKLKVIVHAAVDGKETLRVTS